MITIIAGIVMLGILVFVHELGHFCIAKLCGVKVLTFSLGFGPRLVAKTWGETEYCISAIPLGGYVQMLGEGSGEQGEDAPLTPAEEQRSFAKQSVSRRMAIIAAGPIMNLLLPFLVLPAAYLIGVNLPAYLEQAPCVGYVVSETEGSAAGFMREDCILEVGGTPVETWTDTGPALINRAGEELVFKVERNGQEQVISLAADNSALEGLQAIGLLPRQDAVIGGLSPQMPAAKAGLQEGDRILAIGDRVVSSWYDLKEIIQSVGGESTPFRILRDEQVMTYEIAPSRQGDAGSYLIGIAPLQETLFKRFAFMDAVSAGFDRTLELIDLTLVFIQKLFAGHVSTSNIGGPITVVQIAGQAAQTDMSSILSVLAFLSIQLGILNLLPIPILDGGHLFFNLFELLFRKPLSMRAREIAQQIGLVLLLLLMVLAFYNDIVRILGS